MAKKISKKEAALRETLIGEITGLGGTAPDGATSGDLSEILAALKSVAAEAEAKGGSGAPSCFATMYDSTAPECQGCGVKEKCSGVIAVVAEELTVEEAVKEAVAEEAKETPAAPAERSPHEKKSVTAATFNTNDKGKLEYVPDGTGSISFGETDRVKILKGKYADQLGTIKKFFPPRNVFWVMVDGVSNTMPDIRPDNLAKVE